MILAYVHASNNAWEPAAHLPVACQRTCISERNVGLSREQELVRSEKTQSPTHRTTAIV